MIHFESLNSGLWVGSTLQAVGHVAATGEIIGQNGGNFALVTKMGRVACLLPMLMWLGISSKQTSEETTSWCVQPKFEGEIEIIVRDRLQHGFYHAFSMS